MRGLNTEINPKALARRQAQDSLGFPEFFNLTMQKGVITPIRSDGTHASPTFAESNLGTLAVSDSFTINGESGFQAYVALAGGTPMLRDSGGGTSALTVGQPGVGTFAGYRIDRGVAGPGTYGVTTTYAAAFWDGGNVGGLSNPFTVTSGLPYIAPLTVSSGTPTRGDTLTAGTAGTATVQSFIAYLAHADGPFVCLTDLSGTLASGATVTWGTDGTGTLGYAPMEANKIQLVKFPRGANFGGVGTTASGASGTATCVYKRYETSDNAYYFYGMTSPYGLGETVTMGTSSYPAVSSGMFGASLDFSGPVTMPTGITDWSLYRLADDGIYYRVGTGTTVADPYAPDEVQSLPAYDGPLDANGFPYTLAALGACQTLCLHKGCLFVAEGRLAKWSEGAVTGQEYRWFREGYGLDCGGEIWAFVSRGETLEVFTDQGIKFIIGNSPYFEIRDSQVHEIASSRFSVVGTDFGTFYLAADGLRLLRNHESTLLSLANNGPWFDAIADPSLVVAGASRSKYYLCDGTGRAIRFDWGQKEWMERTFSTCPAGFLWSATDNYLVAKVGATYLSIENGTSAVSWRIRYPTRPGSRNTRLPTKFWLDNVGPMSIAVYVDDDLIRTIGIPDTLRGRVRLPQARGAGWYMVLSGSGTPTTNGILGVNFE